MRVIGIMPGVQIESGLGKLKLGKCGKVKNVKMDGK